MAEEITGHLQQGVFHLTLNRPERRNALVPGMADELARRVEDASAVADLSAIVLRGAGGHFSVGLDLKWFASLGAEPSRDQLAAGLGSFQGAVLALVRAPVPVIAVLQGNVAGFGLDLALAADIRLADSGAVLSSAFTSRGLVPDGGSTFTLPALVGTSKAFRILALGEPLSASDACQAGVVDYQVPPERLEAKLDEITTRLADQAGSSVRAVKRLVRQVELDALEEAMEQEAEQQLMALTSPDFHTRMRQFLSRKSP